MFRRGEGFGSWLTLMAVLVVALVLFGCDSSGDESGSSVTEPLESTGAAEPQPMGTAAEDEAMAADVQRYFARNAHTAPWFTDIESISVAAGVVTVETTLNVEEPSGRVAASQICSLIQGSDCVFHSWAHGSRRRGTPDCLPRSDRMTRFTIHPVDRGIAADDHRGAQTPAPESLPAY